LALPQLFVAGAGRRKAGAKGEGIFTFVFGGRVCDGAFSDGGARPGAGYGFPSPMSAIGSQSDLHFTIGLYCIKGVPMTGASSNPPVGVPFDTKTWGYQISVTTNAIGEKVFIHP